MCPLPPFRPRFSSLDIREDPLHPLNNGLRRATHGPQACGLLDADGKALGLCWSLSDEVGPTGMRLEQIVRLLTFHVASKPGVRKPELRHSAEEVALVCTCHLPQASLLV